MAISIRRESLADVIASIRDRIVGRLETDDPRLAGLQAVFYGRQQSIGTMKAPSLWVVAEPYSPESSGGATMIHRVPYNIVALVKDTNPEQGIKTAERLAHGAYDVLLEGRTLDDTVSLVTPGQVDPGFEAGNNKQLQFAAVQLVFEFRRKE